MKNIIAFGASNSSKSINKQLASFVAGQIQEAHTKLLDLNDYEMPIYSIDRQEQNGIPEVAQKFKQHILQADGLVISFAENNGCYSSAFKNIFDWISRIKSETIWEQKKMFLLSTSPGARGGQTVLDLAKQTFPFQGGQLVASFSLPFFQQNFSKESGIIDTELCKQFKAQLQKFQQSLV